MKRMMKLLFMLMCINIAMVAFANEAPTTTIGPADTYGFLTAPDGSTWTYTAAYALENGHPKSAEISIYDNFQNLVGTLNETFELAETDLWVRDVEINSLVTRKFFNSDNNIEIMLFISVATKDYKGRFYNSVYTLSPTASKHVCNVNGNQVLAKNISTTSNDNYTMIFFRQEYQGDVLFYNYDVYFKADYGTSEPVLKHTFEIPYQHIASLNDPMPIYMMQSGKYTIDYVVAQYEKPFLDPDIPITEEPVVNPDNSLVITRYDNKFKQLSEIKIPMEPDENSAYLYTFYSLGGLGGQNDVMLDYEGTGEMTFVVTVDNYETASDGSVSSYYLYDSRGNKLNTIAEYTLGKVYLSDLPGYDRQYGFFKNENEVEFIEMVDVPSCKTVARIPFYNGGNTLSGSWDRVLVGDSYQYVVSLLQGDNAADGTIHQRIAWFTNKGKLHHYDDLNLGKNVETALVNIQSSVLNPRLFNTDNAYEYMVLIKRTKANSKDKEEVLLICNNEGESLLELTADVVKGGALSSIDVFNAKTNPSLFCSYSDGKQFTLNYYALPLNPTTLKGEGTLANPYLISNAEEFIQIDNEPNACYQIVNDIDFGQAAFDGLQKVFSGKLDGGKHAITNLFLNESGLFCEVVDTAVIKLLTIEQPVLAISNQSLYAGIVANTMRGGMTDDGAELHATISNVHITSPIIVGTDCSGVIGGLIGEASLFVDVIQCSVSDAKFTVAEAESLGGLVGAMLTSSNVQAGAFTGTIEGGYVVGGIAGSIDSNSPIQNAHVDAHIAGKMSVGGIVGSSDRATVTNCVAEGTLELQHVNEEGGVGGIVGAMAQDVLGNQTDALVYNNIVAQSSITAPEGAFAHRVVGFSSCNEYEYDWDHIDWNKPQSEWPRIYGKAEKCLKDNYVISDLAVVDATVEAVDTTTEGADLSANELTTEWLAEHNFAIGKNSSTPWQLADKLALWFEIDGIFTAVDNVVNAPTISIENGYLFTDGMIQVYNLNGMLVAHGNGSIQTVGLNGGVYVVTVTNNAGRSAMKMLIP